MDDVEEGAVDGIDEECSEELSFDLLISEGSIPSIDKKGTDFLCVDNNGTGESLLFKFSEDGFRIILILSVDEGASGGGVGTSDVLNGCGE